jgi:ribosomal-protein-alanine N-acetyltransferase
MDTFPVLKTDRLLLREFVQTDAQAVFDIFSLDQVTIFLDSETMQTIAEAEKKVQNRINMFKDGKGIRWGITLRDQPETLIGSCGYFSLHPQWFSVEIGYELHPRHWRQGIMSEALRAVIDFGFSEQFFFALNRIEAQTYLYSEPSMSLLKKLGFIDEGVRRECFYWKNKFHDMHCFSFLRRDWKTQTAK